LRPSETVETRDIFDAIAAMRKSSRNVVSDSLAVAAGAQEPQCTSKYLRISSTAGRRQRVAHGVWR